MTIFIDKTLHPGEARARSLVLSYTQKESYKNIILNYSWLTILVGQASKNTFQLEMKNMPKIIFKCLSSHLFSFGTPFQHFGAGSKDIIIINKLKQRFLLQWKEKFSLADCLWRY